MIHAIKIFRSSIVQMLTIMILFISFDIYIMIHAFKIFRSSFVQMLTIMILFIKF